MILLQQIVGTAGVIGSLVAGVMMLRHVWGLVRLGEIRLLTGTYGFFQPSRYRPEVQRHIRGCWRWFGVGAACGVLLGLGAAALSS